MIECHLKKASHLSLSHRIAKNASNFYNSIKSAHYLHVSASFFSTFLPIFFRPIFDFKLWHSFDKVRKKHQTAAMITSKAPTNQRKKGGRVQFIVLFPPLSRSNGPRWTLIWNYSFPLLWCGTCSSWAQTKLCDDKIVSLAQHFAFSLSFSVNEI